MVYSGKVGVVTGKDLVDLMDDARARGYAIPAVNCTSSSTANCVLEAAAKASSPVIIQVSNGGGSFLTGKGVKTPGADAAGSVALAMHVRSVASWYGVPVVLHSDHCAKKLLPWFDGMCEANEDYFGKYGEPLFSSHMLDLSEEPDDENIAICVEYHKRLSKMNIWLEMEIGITGGEEDGVNNEDVDPDKLYTTPEQVYRELSMVSDQFTIAAAFGNVHGVYKGDIDLKPSILKDAQGFIGDKLMEDGLIRAAGGTRAPEKPVNFVFHGGSGSDLTDIREALDYGVVKMNIDTDTQWSYWSGVSEHQQEFGDFLQQQVGNPTGADSPNKKYYDPRAWVRRAEKKTVERLGKAFEDLRCQNILGLPPVGEPTNTFGPRRGGLPV
ncbi:hypothetical protein TeGR_g2665 [Tetraparma gracilis]|uniref:fructose-bisphosphate aldolase n=1 Tax=Tetraparma gracilis TaxID=2962635 RepID=A0ABQ6MLW3_9STRA|nr:hypothetical protein TeGR_g2665 [Tetraparma gracilis]